MMRDSRASTGLTIDTLNLMSPFQLDEDNNWVDVVQRDSVEDMWKIMNSFIPQDLYQSLFPGTDLPTLPPYLQEIADTTAKDNDGNILQPAEFYESLSTMVLCMSLKDWDNPNAKKLNAKRAETRLKEETSASLVYKKHMDLLFQYHWQEKNKLTAEFLDDQIQNSSRYRAEIEAEEEAQIKDIDENVYEKSSSGLKDELRLFVQESAKYAKDSNMYWAFCYYTYHTSPSMLAHFQTAIGNSTGNEDGSELTRTFQKHLAVLSALDPSGLFSDMYNNVLNTFLGTTVMMSLFDFETADVPLDLITLYLDEFVESCLTSSNAKLVEAGEQIQSFVQQGGFEETLDEVMNILRTAGTGLVGASMAPFVAQIFVNNLKTRFANSFKEIEIERFGEAFVLATTTIGAGFLLLNYDELSAVERAALITTAVELGLQAFNTIVDQGGKLASVFVAGGLSKMQKVASVFRFGGDPSISGPGVLRLAFKKLSDGMKRIGMQLGQWLGKRIGNASTALTKASVKMTKYLTKTLGKNLDEFMTTRLGPVFTIAGMVFDIIGIASGDTGLDLAMDIIGLIEGTLVLFCTVGGWFAGTSAVLAGMISVAGPLSVVLAIVGLGLLLFKLFSKPPDPVAEFIDDHAGPAGLALNSQCNAVDYFGSYMSKKKGYEVLGITLSPGSMLSHSVRAAEGTGVTLGKNDNTSNYVFQIVTGGHGQSTIYTSVGTDEDGYSSVRYLSVSADGSVTFEEEISSNTYWKVGARTNDPGLEEGFLSMMYADLQYTAADSEFSGLFLHVDDNGKVVLGNNASSWKLEMSGIRPAGMEVQDISFLGGLENVVPSTSLQYGPSFPFMPSLETSYKLVTALPLFLTFDDSTGRITPNGKSAEPIGITEHIMEALNDLGKGECKFTIEVKNVGS